MPSGIPSYGRRHPYPKGRHPEFNGEALHEEWVALPPNPDCRAPCGCQEKPLYAGYCGAHYAHLYRFGNKVVLKPLKRRPPTLPAAAVALEEAALRLQRTDSEDDEEYQIRLEHLLWLARVYGDPRSRRRYETMSKGKNPSYGKAEVPDVERDLQVGSG